MLSLETDETILAAADAMIGTAREHMKTQQLHQVLNCLWAVVADANRYFASEAPWALAKTDPKRQGTVLYVTAELLRQSGSSRRSRSFRRQLRSCSDLSRRSSSRNGASTPSGHQRGSRLALTSPRRPFRRSHATSRRKTRTDL